MGEILDWIYGKIVGFLGNFFASMGNMGVDLFDMEWVQSVILFFSRLGWALFLTGLVVAAFEMAIEYQSGRGNFKDLGLNSIKGMMAVSLFTITPIQLYKLSVDLQRLMSQGITGFNRGVDELAMDIVDNISNLGTSVDSLSTGAIFGDALGVITSPIFGLFIIIAMGYAVIKCFFSNLKRGGILLIQIAVGSLYMFSVVRGYSDAFIQWIKQVIGLCLTTFLQATILTAGLMVFKDNALLGLGLMLSAAEVPRVAGAFGMDTTAQGNVMSIIYGAQTAVNTAQRIAAAIPK